MKMRNYSVGFFVSCLLILCSLSVILPSQISGDGGWVPFFDEFSVYEPGQKAIIAWDGDEEILILSVDVIGGGDNKVLHMVPLPSMPTLTLGNISAFNTINNLIESRGYFSNGGTESEAESEAEGEFDGGEKGFSIEFHDQIGPHNLTVVKVMDYKNFTTWVTTFLLNEGVTKINFPNGTAEVVKYYIEKKINYFVFDVIEINKTEQSVQPIIYQFKSKSLYFPLHISSLIEGVSEINVVTITPVDFPFNTEDFYDLGFRKNIGFRVSEDEIESINSNIAELISDDGYLNFYEDLFPLKELEKDVNCNELNNINWMLTSYNHFNEPLFYDCNGDELEDIIIFSKGQDDYDYGVQRSGSVDLQKSNVLAIDSTTGKIIWYYNTNAEYLHLDLLDIDSDGDKEIFGVFNQRGVFTGKEYIAQCTFFTLDPTTGDIIWNKTFQNETYWNFNKDDMNRISDIDRDGISELLFYSSYYKSKITVINLDDGSILWSYQLSDKYGSLLNFEIIDIEKDFKLEIIIRTKTEIQLLKGKTGKTIWKKDFDYYDNYYNNQHNLLNILYDIDKDNKLEMFIPIGSNSIKLINCEDGSKIWTCKLSSYNPKYQQSHGQAFESSFKFRDIDLDDNLDIIYYNANEIYALNSTNGNVIWHYFFNINDTQYVKSRFHKFDFCNADNDNNLEIMYYIEDFLCVLNIENGSLLWSKKIYPINNYSFIDEIFTKDINNDQIAEIIYTNGYNLTVINSKNGDECWKLVFDKGFHLQSDLKDFDKDGKLELLIYVNNKIAMINAEDGTIVWGFIKENRYLSFKGMDDINHDGINDMIIFDTIGMYAINPITGGLIWNFTAGEYFNTYHIFENEKQKDTFLIFSGAKIYSINDKKMNYAMFISSVTDKPDKLMQITTFVSYQSNPISGVKFELIDLGNYGNFSKVTEEYPGVYDFNYRLSKINLFFPDSIEILIQGYHPKYLGFSKLVNLNLSYINTSPEDPSKPDFDPNKKSLVFYGIVTKDTITPGETTSIFFKILIDDISIVEGLDFKFFDGNVNGIFSEVEFIGNDFFSVKYTAPEKIDIAKLKLLILISHQNYSDGLGSIELFVDRSSSLIPNNASIDNPLQINNNELNLQFNPYPQKIKPGDSTIVMINITSNGIPITNATFHIFDYSLGGNISNIIEYGGGHYSFIYTIPEDVPSIISSSILLLYVFHENFSTSNDLIKIDIFHEPEPDYALDDLKIFLDIYAYPNRIYAGESTIFKIELSSELLELIYSDFNISLTDFNRGGIFEFIERDNEGNFFYKYTSPDTNAKSILIGITIFYKNSELKIETYNLELLPNNTAYNNKLEDASKNDALPFGLFVIMLLTLISGILIGTFVLSSYISYSNKKSKDNNKQLNKPNKKEDKELKSNLIKNEGNVRKTETKITKTNS